MITRTAVPAVRVAARKTRSPGRTAAPLMSDAAGVVTAGGAAPPKVGPSLMRSSSPPEPPGVPRRRPATGPPGSRPSGSGRAERVDRRLDLGAQLGRQRHVAGVVEHLLASLADLVGQEALDQLGLLGRQALAARSEEHTSEL